MFNRTPKGLASEYLFHSVDFVVYCEGLPDSNEAATMDEMFWNKIFVKFGLKAKCKSKGSKTDLLCLAEIIRSNNVLHVIVAMDRDYDSLRNEIIRHPRIFYTFGYSWESDVVIQLNFQNSLNLFVNVVDPDGAENEFNDFVRRQSAILRRMFALDLKYIDHTERLFDRSRPMSIINIRAKKEPELNVRKLLEQAKKMGKFQTVRLASQIYKSSCGLQTFHGKSVSRLIYHWFVFFSSKIKGHRKIPYDVFISNLISTVSIDDDHEPRNLYYKEMMANL